MNNALFSDEEVVVDIKPQLRKRETELVAIIDAINKVCETSEWLRLKELVLDDLVSSLERRLFSEVSKSVLDTPEIYRLNGQLSWAKKYADLSKLVTTYRIELVNIKKQL